MILGIDVGGTHTDAVCISRGEIASSTKVETSPDLVESITDAISSLKIDCSNIRRVVLSTTLSTNAIIENRLAQTGMIVGAGPGINPESFFLNEDFHLVNGAIDHRGREYIPLDEPAVIKAAEKLRQSGIDGLGIVSKFSVRNSSHELRIKSMTDDKFKHISMGHQMNGSLNFPRRINTTFFNTGVLPLQVSFVHSVRKALAMLGIRSRLLFLKADGGTFSSSAADRLPVETIMSGPAASMMGAFALRPGESCSAVMDIGGTTTDIGILVSGVPVFEPKGISVKGLKTLVRGFKMISIGAGGDSAVSAENGAIKVGPERKGIPCCFGGNTPTTMDALRVMGDIGIGSLEKASAGLKNVADACSMDIRETAEHIIRALIESIGTAFAGFLNEVNSHPVYTIHEMLHHDTIRPDRIILIGAPAMALKPHLEKHLGCKCEVPENYAVANAIGAAVSKTTAQISLLADTQRRQIICPELDMDEIIPATFTPADVLERGKKLINDNAAYLGLADDAEIDVVEEQNFNMVNGFWTVGRNMRLKLQTRQGILDEFKKGAHDV